MPATRPFTPIADIDAKLDIIEHLNQDHIEEVQAIAAYYYPDLAITNPLIIDIYKEGMLISAQVNNKAQELFVDFKLEGDLEEQVLYLAYTAMAEQGRDLTGNKKHYFEVIGKQKLTPNMTRLTLHSETPLPENYAWLCLWNDTKSTEYPPPSADSSRQAANHLANHLHKRTG